jgi:radical SAM superfamily enzyme YgiQ (UPF0313 family)
VIRYEEPVIRPPAEAESLILQATTGCSHNRCAFCVTYRGKRFRPRPLDTLFAEIDWAAGALPGLRRVFLADGDPLALPTERLLAILTRIGERLPTVRRVTAYASPQNFRRKGDAELARLAAAGLTQVYVGFESGDDEVLARVGKGATADEIAAACDRVHAAGIKISATVVLGLGGPRLSARHALATAKLIDRARPRFASALTLMLPPGSRRYADAFGDPTWRLLAPGEMLAELRALVAAVAADGVIFRANHASNYLPLEGTFQKSKARLLAELDAALADPCAWRPESLRGM